MAHLTRSKRDQIEILVRAGKKQQEMADLIGCSQGTISRELSRGSPPQRFSYRGNQAQRRAGQRKRTERRWYDDPQVFRFVLELLRKRQSPEQIVGRMKRESLWHKQHAISAKTIYTWIWENKEQGGCLYLHLRRRGKRPKWFGVVRKDKTRIPNRRDIAERPKIVDRWKRCGDWESDLVVSPRSGTGAVATFVERFSKYLQATIVQTQGADAFVQAAHRAFATIPESLRLTMTHDNGKEICGHEQITNDLCLVVYCARPFRSWERGLNEHTNGLLRDFFPKGTDFGTVSQQELAHVVELINNRPRRSLNFRTPKEVLDAEIKRYAFEASE
jgi:IS30 family transposase